MIIESRRPASRDAGRACLDEYTGIRHTSAVHSPSAFTALNPPQLAAATHGVVTATGGVRAGPLLVIAGAGTGKTSTLAHRVAHLVLAGVPPERLLLLTFTRRAAQEMSRRAELIVARALADARDGPPPPVRLPWSGTFHSIANRLLRRHAEQVGLDPQFTVLDRSDAADLMDVARQEFDFGRRERRFPRKDTCVAIYSHRVNTRWTLERVLADAFPWCAEWCAELMQLARRYVELKQDHRVLDYDDLLLYWHGLMQEPSAAADIAAMYDHVLVDEYQDTNVLQASIVQALRPDGAGVTVVGDDAQSIYSFRAATVENILQFPDRYTPRARVVKLEDNYRSVQPILDAANALIGEATRQYQKQLKSARSSAQRPRLVTVADDAAQASYVVDRILDARERGVGLREQAVLFRSSHHSDVLELELARRNVPYVKYGGLRFLEAAHVKDLLSLLRWAHNPRNGVAAFRALQLLPGMGPVHADRCCKVFAATAFSWPTLAAHPVPVAARDDWPAFVDTLIALAAGGDRDVSVRVGLARRWYEPMLERLHDAPRIRAADLEQLERIAAGYDTLEQFLTELALDPPQASGDLAGPPLLDEDYLVLSTVHSAKGQEWTNVHVLNVSDGSFPSEFATGRPESIEEERRLLYVAMTRAREELDLICPLKYYVTQQSRHGDAHVYGARSRFLTAAVRSMLEAVSWPPTPQGTPVRADGRPQIDVGRALRDFWS
jgi:ATP-dependent DNA helicase UvrD/PcrA